MKLTIFGIKTYFSIKPIWFITGIRACIHGRDKFSKLTKNYDFCGTFQNKV